MVSSSPSLSIQCATLLLDWLEKMIVYCLLLQEDGWFIFKLATVKLYSSRIGFCENLTRIFKTVISAVLLQHFDSKYKWCLSLPQKCLLLMQKYFCAS